MSRRLYGRGDGRALLAKNFSHVGVLLFHGPVLWPLVSLPLIHVDSENLYMLCPG